MRNYPAMLLVLFIAVGAFGILLGSGMRDGIGGQPLGTDFVSFYSSSLLVLDHQSESAYRPPALYAAQQSVLGEDVPFYAWLYPPMALLIVAPLATVPYLPALAVWLLGTAGVYVSALWRMLPRKAALLPIFAFPGMFLTIGHGQNAMLSAGLLAWGLILLRRHPWLAGIVLGLLIYKPQLGLLLPIAFLASRNWKALLATSASAVAFSAASFLALGEATWTAFLEQSGLSVQVLRDELVGWEKMIGAYAGFRMLGAPDSVAWIVQALVSVGAAIAVWAIWRGSASFPLKSAALAAGTLLATPFALDYESTFLAVALIGIVVDGLSSGFRRFEISLLAIAWASPLLWRIIAQGTGFPVGFATVATVFWVISRRARTRTGLAVPAR